MANAKKSPAGLGAVKHRAGKTSSTQKQSLRPSGSARAYRSPAFAAIHEGVADLHKAGLIDSKTMRDFDTACLTPVLTLSPSAIRDIRKKASISQSVFALHLNVTPGVVSKWERGEKQPRGPAAKLLTLAAKNGLAAIT